MTLDTKNNTRPPFQFTRTSVGFMKKLDSTIDVEGNKDKTRNAFRDRNLSQGFERDFINENIGKI